MAEQMTGRERVFAAIMMKELPDRVPVVPLLLTRAIREGNTTVDVAQRNPQVMADCKLKAHAKFGGDVVAAGTDLFTPVENLGAEPAYREAVAQMGFDLEMAEEREWDAGLGNGGLGRLAACFLDSAASLGLPFYGYGIRYEYGIFRQQIADGFQVEAPDNWLRYGNPWEVQRPDVLFPVRFYGRTHHGRDPNGEIEVGWLDTEDLYAMAYDTPIVGFRNDVVNTLRLWSAKSSREFDLAHFSTGEYVRAVEDKTHSENITKVLYPRDDQYAGKELRLKQQYFFVSATLQDVIRRFRKHDPQRPWEQLPGKVAIQLNDPHPVLAIPELMRVLVDENAVAWERAWSLTQAVFAYTNHTVLPEALERWPVDLLRRLLPRHFEIIEEIDRRFRAQVRARHPGDDKKPRRMGVLEDGSVRMANLAVLGSHSVNGVAQLHTQIVQSSVFPEYHAFFPGRFNNKTNGITPRRWLLGCNPGMAGLISEAIGDGWTRDLEGLRALEPLADDATFRERWAAVKRRNKVRFIEKTASCREVPLEPDLLFDFQVKRIHEYKRQLLNVMHAIALYHRILDGNHDQTPRAVMLAGKAAPGYFIAKLIVKLVHSVASLVGGNEKVRRWLRVLFLPNYSVSLAELIMPACELSEQISTAGMEASGTGNMKAALNGALTIGTLDGANIEIRDEVGADNIFIFGKTADEIRDLRRANYQPRTFVEQDPELRRVIDTLAHGALERANPGLFRPLVDNLLGSDHYFLCADFRAYLDCQLRASAAYRRPDEWTRMSILNVARMGKFSSDRTVREYASEIWSVEPVGLRS